MLPDRDVDGLAPAALVERLADPVPDVRVQALHALACDRCKGPSPAVHKKAAWYLPGGPIHRRTG